MVEGSVFIPITIQASPGGRHSFGEPAEKGFLWKEKDLQRRGCELSREIKWAQLFQSLDDFDKIRLIENQSSLRRKWMESLPIHKGLTLSDSQVRYGIQECLLSKFPEAVSPTRTCLECRNLEDGPLHHFTCKATDALRTARHHAIHHLFEQKMKECNARSIERYPFVGLGADGRTRIGDTAAIIRDVRSNFDYMIVAADYTRKVRIPPLQEIMAEVEVDKARGSRDIERFLFWEDHSDESPHPVTVEIRKMRQIIFQETLGKDLSAADRTKYRHYGDLGIVPITFSARGSMGRHTIPTVDSMCLCHPEWDYSDQVQFRSRFLIQLSVSLLKSAHAMKIVRESLAFEGM